MSQNSDREKRARRSTEGRRLFAKKLEELRLSQAAAAKRLGVSQPTVNAWCTGLKRPEPEWRERIEAEFGVPRDAWYTRSEREIAQPEVRS
jgi:transcriptional regulator with XRE-family HTH domain